ncbi:MAG TPA: ABC transporter permease, partial [Gemmata sp.]|nr:ABC transporter permease [Gemmata sp.]
MSTSPAPAPSQRPFAVPAGPWVGFAAVLAIFSLLIGVKGELGSFLSVGNLQVVLHEATIPAIVGLGMLMVLISGGIDLSVGAVIALVTVVTMKVFAALHGAMGPGAATGVLAAAAGVACGGLCGLANGLLVTRLKLPPFVATLGMIGVARGLAVWLAERKVLAFDEVVRRPEWVETMARVSFLNPGLWSLVLLAVGTGVLLHFTVFGRHVYAVGSNEATARLCGVNVGRTKLLVYTLAGLLT